MANNKNIIQRIEAIKAIYNIKELKFRYWKACDAKEPIKILECFCSDNVHIDFEDFGTFSSAQDMVNKYEINSCHNHLIEQHSGKNPIIKLLSNSKAEGSWSLSYSLIDTKKNISLSITGTYKDLYIKDEFDQWLIKKTVFKKTSTIYRALSEGKTLKPKIGRTLGFKETI
jgi:hypothetical protein